MKLQCAYSGIQFECSHFSAYLDKGVCHPVFLLSQEKLYRHYPKWLAGHMNDTDSYLLFLAALNSSGNIVWHTSARRTEHTNAIVAKNMELLFHTLALVNQIKHPGFDVPSYAITGSTASLGNINDLLQMWKASYHEFVNGYKQQAIERDIHIAGEKLLKLINNPYIKPEKYAKILADWAEKAGEFPRSITPTPLGNMPLAEYWKGIIIKCYNTESMLSIPKKDVVELLEYIEENIESGTVQSYHLFSTVREGLDRLSSFFSVGTSFKILQKDDTVEQANIKMLIEQAPETEPRRVDYPSEIAFIKARARWNLKKEHGNG